MWYGKPRFKQEELKDPINLEVADSSFAGYKAINFKKKYKYLATTQDTHLPANNFNIRPRPLRLPLWWKMPPHRSFCIAGPRLPAGL
jgi:hypothetical protein